MSFAEDYFNRDIAKHEMTIIRDDGVNRHIRFQQPGTMCMHFDLITWAGYLCFTGDMGTYVFRRLHDMFEFFRKGEKREPYQISFSYWAEKLEAEDRSDGTRKFSADLFRSAVKDYFDQDTDDWDDERKTDLWKQITDEVLCEAYDNGQFEAFSALHNFEHKGFEFVHWENTCEEYSHRFLWCCHALEWGIDVYDKAKAPASEVVNGGLT